MRRRILVPIVVALAVATTMPSANARLVSSLSFGCQVKAKTYPDRLENKNCVGLATGAGAMTNNTLHAAWVADGATFKLKMSTYNEFGCGSGNGNGTVKIEPVAVTDSDGNVDLHGKLEMPLVWIHILSAVEVRAGGKNGPPPATLTWNTPSGERQLTDMFGYDGRGAWLPDVARWVERGCPVDHSTGGEMTVRLAVTMWATA